MRQATIVAPGGIPEYLLAHLTDTLTIQARGGVLTPNTEGAFSNVTGLVDIPCMVAPGSGIGGGASQGTSGDFIVTERAWTAILDDYYASLHAATVSLKAVVNGITYGAVVDGDSQQSYTRLRLTLTET